MREIVITIQRFEKRIEQVFAQHADANLFAALPGAGKALAPRLLVAFGADRSRYDSAAQLQSFAGVAPVTKRSGRQCVVQRCWACPKFLLQTFHEFAHHCRHKSAWARAYYQLQRHRGKGHHAAVRAPAHKWIRILFVCWRDRTPYDENRYLADLRKRGAPLLQYLNPT